MEIIEFQGNSTIMAPELPGIYAWYFRPTVFENHETEILGKLITNPARVKTEIAMRYRLTWEVDSDVEILHGARHRPAAEFISETVASGSDLIKSFFQDFMVPHFAKPLYIGIHSTNLRERIQQHSDTLTNLWNSDSLVSQYLVSHPDATVEKVIKDLDLNHSFALNARVKGLTPRDLVVYVFPIKNSEKLRDLEQILQLLADPICGRR